MTNSVNLSRLEQLFVEQGRQSFWPQIAQMLEYWVRIAQTAELTLRPEGEIDTERYAQAVAAATGREVTKVVFVSLSDPFDLPAWVSEDYQDTLHNSLRAGLRSNLVASLEIRIWERLSAALRAGLWECFHFSFWISLGTTLENPLRYILEYCLWDGLFCAMGFALIGDEEKFKQCHELLAVQEQALGLGFHEEDPSVFLALCA